jgi:hypothetical protein
MGALYRKAPDSRPFPGRKRDRPGRVRAKGASTSHLSGFIRVVADSLDHARTLVVGNPVFESGGTVEIRELPQTD